MRLLGWAAVGCVMALCGAAHAQTASDEFGIERFRLSTDPSGVLDVDPAYIGDHLDYSAGASIGFAHDPLVIYDNTMAAVDPLVEQRLSTDLVGSLSLWNRLQLGIGATIVGYQSGTGGLTVDSLPKGGLGDFRLVPKVLLGAKGRFVYAIVPTLTVPGGSAGGWLREAGVTFAPAVAVTGNFDRLRGDLNVGYRMRPRTKVAGLVSDDELFARVAADYGIGSGTELLWSTSLAMPVVDANKNQIALEMFAGVRQRVTRRAYPENVRHAVVVRLFAAGGVGLENGYGTPDWRVLGGVVIEGFDIPPPPPQLPIHSKQDTTDVHEVPTAVPKAKLTGTVTSTTGQPIANAAVTIGSLQLTTDDNGHFETELEGGTVAVTANADGYDPGSASVTVAGGATGDVIVKLQRKVRQGQLRGQVLSFAGKPVLGATITVGDKSVTSDAEGDYSIDLPEGAFEVTIEAAGFATQKRKVNIKLDAVTVLNADMRAGK